MGLQVEGTIPHYFKIDNIFVNEEDEITYITVSTFDERNGQHIGVGNYEVPFNKVNPIGKDNLKAIFYPYLKKTAFANFIKRKDVYEH